MSIATPSGPIPVTVCTFERLRLERGGTTQWGGGTGSQDRDPI